jgi:UDP-galactopyranose mutase
MALSRVGQRLYGMIFHPYTIKQWAKEPKELGPEVTARIPVRNNHDGRYFDDKYQALPSHGYTNFFEKLLSNELIDVSLKTDFFDARDAVSCGRTYFTGPIDSYFASQNWEKLEYRSLDFERKVVRNVDFFQPKSVVNHPSAQDNFTRIVEYKHLLNQSSPHTILFYEHSKDGGEPYYPVPNEKNKALYAQYQKLALNEPNVTFVGRLANYKYFNMDQAILNALQLFDTDNGRVYDDEKGSTSEATKDLVTVSSTANDVQTDDKVLVRTSDVVSESPREHLRGTSSDAGDDQNNKLLSIT